MADQLRFYLDENLPVEVARQLRLRGVEVVTARDLGLLGASDVYDADELRNRIEFL